MEGNERLKNLALSETGFLFDPSTGNTYTLNETGIIVLKLLKEGNSKDEIVKVILSEYDVEIEQLERDVTDLLIQLQELGIYQ
ncbi:MAG: HPr-rel-A system PqqD family peptide chaperone [Leptospiraceae bacterium]|nr:HPr-rel-A system PqqD family peptide chaperone [Leptospiraceae bacterium]